MAPHVLHNKFTLFDRVRSGAIARGNSPTMAAIAAEFEWAKQPPPEPPLTVGLDGGFVHAFDQKSRTEGWFEVIAGKSVQTDGDAKVFAFVNKFDTKPKRRLYEVLRSHLYSELR